MNAWVRFNVKNLGDKTPTTDSKGSKSSKSGLPAIHAMIVISLKDIQQIAAESKNDINLRDNEKSNLLYSAK